MGLKVRDLVGFDAMLAAAAKRVEHDALIAGSHTEHTASTLIHPHITYTPLPLVEDVPDAGVVTDADLEAAWDEPFAEDDTPWWRDPGSGREFTVVRGSTSHDPGARRRGDTRLRRTKIAQDRGDQAAIVISFFPWVTVTK